MKEWRKIIIHLVRNPFVKESRIFSTEDAERYAKKRLPRLIYDFIEGAAGREIASLRNRTRFDEILLQPRIMEHLETKSLSMPLLGKIYDLPFGIAPMGMCNLAWPNSDWSMATTARDFNFPACLSTAGSSSLEDFRNWGGENSWFQLYVGKTIENSLELVKRAEAAGYENLILTVDVPQVSPRLRDLRNGFAVPFKIGVKQFVDFATKPRWVIATLMNGIPRFANNSADSGQSGFDRNESRTGADWDFFDKLRNIWKGKLIVKGVTSAGDALRIKQAGADAVYVSNHGGRQLDSAPAAIDCLPAIRRAVGWDYPLIFDSGIRSGEDVVKALALGANFVMLGRPVLFALGAEGKIGLQALLQKFGDEIGNVLAQCCLSDVRKISPAILYDCPKDLSDESNRNNSAYLSS